MFNKIDLLGAAELSDLKSRICKELNWEGQMFEISAINSAGVADLSEALMSAIETHRDKMANDEAYVAHQETMDQEMELEIRLSIQRTKTKRVKDSDHDDSDDLDWGQD